MTHLVVVESPAKAKTINRYLGNDYVVVASYGHIRDLPSKNGSVDPNNQFQMVWEVDARSKKHIDAIIKESKNADSILLATDPDREGEAISWHIAQLLMEKKALQGKKLQRIVFNEITKSAVQHALENPREINQELVDAYMARRALDYLVGFNISPVLWRKLPGSRSAGRVQSVALRLIVHREQEIEKFIKEEYWSILGQFSTPSKEFFDAKLTHLNGVKLEKFSINNEEKAKAAVSLLEKENYAVASIDKKQMRRNPAAPFITSTLQQEASRKLGFSASRTMQTAQKLYEGIAIKGESTGLITYMRTDGVQLSQEAVSKMRDFIGKKYGKDYLPASAIAYKSKAKNAQEAHEAIRPTDIDRTPEMVKPYLDETQYKLYELIWRRTLACQMTQAVFDQMSILIDSSDKKHQFKATGSTLVFDGFLRVYKEGIDDQKGDNDEDRLLPRMADKDPLNLKNIEPHQHFTEPPPRYGEASLVKKLEELGIGRPSTYASILHVLQERSYVMLERRQFIPSDRGRLVTTFLENFFQKYVEYDFTAKLEEQLDDISAGERDWHKVMQEFWSPFSTTVGDVMKIDIVSVIDKLEEALEHYLFGEDKDHLCPKCQKGKLSLKLGKFGAFLGCSNYPECPYTRPIGDQATGEGDNAHPQEETPVVGTDPVTGSEITLRKGPYGFYLQWEGEVEAPKVAKESEASTKKKPSTKKTTKSKAPKPVRVGLPAGMAPQSVTLKEAMFLKSLPKEVGIYPETGEKVMLGIGKFGPYIKVGSIFASIPKSISFFEISEGEAITLVDKKKARVAAKKN